jgi:hypothetical protein
VAGRPGSRHHSPRLSRSFPTRRSRPRSSAGRRTPSGGAGAAGEQRRRVPQIAPPALSPRCASRRVRFRRVRHRVRPGALALLGCPAPRFPTRRRAATAFRLLRSAGPYSRGVSVVEAIQTSPWRRSGRTRSSPTTKQALAWPSCSTFAPAGAAGSRLRGRWRRRSRTPARSRRRDGEAGLDDGRGRDHGDRHAASRLTGRDSARRFPPAPRTAPHYVDVPGS